MRSTQQGFTLIELIVVIVILGILAAVAVPKFVSLQGDARFSVLQGVTASMQSTSEMIHGKALAAGIVNGNLPAGSVEGFAAVVPVVNGYVATGTMTQLLNLSPATSFTITAGTGTVQITGASTLTNCQVIYTQPAAGAVPTIAVTGSSVLCN